MSTKSTLIGRKYLILQLRKCKKCGLMFRYPKDYERENIQFYNNFYVQGIVTDIPNDLKLRELILKKFIYPGYDFTNKIHLLKENQASGKVLDFGASWGYVSWQLKNFNYSVISFEISKICTDYGKEKLGLHYVDNYNELVQNYKNNFNIIFSNHVLEHLPTVNNIFQDFNGLLSDNGIICLFVPNCNNMEDKEVFKRKKEFAFGEKHTIAFDMDFFKNNLRAYGFKLLPTLDYENNSDELCILAEKIN